MTEWEKMVHEEYMMPKKEKKITYCAHCGEEVREDEIRYYWDDEWECSDCFEEGAKDYLNDMTADELAYLLSVKKRGIAC